MMRKQVLARESPHRSNSSAPIGQTWSEHGIRLALLVVMLLGVFAQPRSGLSDPYEITMGPAYEYDGANGGRNNILAGLDDEHCLCLYRGYSGKAVILDVDPADWSLTTASSYVYDVNGDYMGLAEIDPAHFLCTYCGDGEVATASVLSINLVDWSMNKETTIIYDQEFGYYNALSPIDATHYLGVHNMWDVTGRAGVFTVNLSDWSIAYGPEYSFEPENGFDFMLSRIDATHHLCIYPSQAEGYTGRAVVLVVDPGTWTVTRATDPFTFATDCDAYSFVSRIDDDHFLCAYQGPSSRGWAVVLTLDPADWSISKETPFEYDTGLGGEPNVTRIDDTHYLCAYKGVDADGYAAVLIVNPSDWTISRKLPFEFDPVRADYPYLCRIDAAHYLCSWEGPDGDGWSTVLEVELPLVGVAENAPARVGLGLSNQPNPFNPRTTITYHLTEPSRVTLLVYTPDGSRLTTLVSQELSAGDHAVTWDGRDERCRLVPSGVYFYRLEVGSHVETRPMVLIR